MQLSTLEKIANEIKFKIILNSSKTGTPHLGSCLSCSDILVVLYYSILNIDINNPGDKLRDRFILSKGHGAAALFQILASKGFFDLSLMDSYGEDGTLLAEHPPAPDYLPGIEAATGSLGHGLPIGLGMAMAAKINNFDYHVYALLGDGECNEGSIWEAANMAAAQKISNLTVIVDSNKWQATDRSSDLVGSTTLVEKWKAFGWNTLEIDGHNLSEISIALKTKADSQPTAIIANTVKGSGVSFMEDDNNWHYRIPTNEEVELAFKELGMKK
tara:strand:+ start:12434 stop:13249 length:816 start_codon:yes stop_codon:yes gene_type:complete